MKKSRWTLLFFILLGLLGGTLISYWLNSVPGLSFLTNSISTEWSPSVDLHILSFSLYISVNISLMSILGMLVMIWAYRKL